jgi:phosphoglycolate phosphatase-like HAD superfamily hydrolase
MNKFGLIIVDFDDTIIDNTRLDLDSFRYITKMYSLLPINDNTIIHWRKNGMLARNILQKLIRDRNDISLDICVKKRLEYLRTGSGGIRLAKIRTGVKNTLEQIKEKGYFVAIVTSRQDKNIVKKIIRNLQLTNKIDKIYCASDIIDKRIDFKNCIELKKSLYKLVLKNHLTKLTNKKVIAVGNLRADVIAAKQMKIKPIAIKGSYRFDSGISKLCKTITNFDELLNIL